MRTCIYTACHLNGSDYNGDAYLGRYLKYLRYYRPLKTELGFTDFVFIDNVSGEKEISILNGNIYNEKLELLSSGKHQDLKIVRCETPLKRGTCYDYPYCWRALYMARQFFDQYDKFLFIDSDCFVLTERLAHWARDLDSGWHALWCDKYHFPEAAISVLCRDTFAQLAEFCVGDYMHHNGRVYESALPYTAINRSFIAGRFGEENIRQAPWMDYYGQSKLLEKLTYRAKSQEAGKD